MPMYDANDPVEQKNREQRKKRLRNFVIFLILLTITAVIYITQEIWLPKLRGLGNTYTTIVNDGKLAAGNFPIEINGGGSYQMECSDNMICLLSDANIYLYNDEGGLLRKRQHAYSNAVLETDSGRVLLYEHGGNRFSLEDRNGIIYSKELDDNIMFVRISDDGFAAAVTASDTYACEITVFDRDGKVIYSRKCVERVGDISFNEDSKGCAISYISAENGSLVTSVQQVSFTENGEKWTSPGLRTLGLELCEHDGTAFVIGIDGCGYVNSSGQIESLFRYEGDFAGGSCEEGKAAVIYNSDDTRKYVMVLFDGIGSDALVLNFDTPLIDVTVSGGLAYVMTQKAVLAYDFKAGLRSTAEVSDGYTGFERSDRYVFLKSFNRIDRINYES